MRHWFLLLTHSYRNRRLALGSSGFVSGGGDSITASLSPRQRLKMSFLGAVESIPTFGSAFAAHEAGTEWLATAIVFTGLGISALLCWALRRQTPLTRIHATQKPDSPPR